MSRSDVMTVNRLGATMSMIMIMMSRLRMRMSTMSLIWVTRVTLLEKEGRGEIEGEVKGKPQAEVVSRQGE